MGFTILAFILLASVLLFLRQQRSQERRLAAERNLPREQRVPRHYRSFTEVENKLWMATAKHDQTRTWENVKLVLQPHELRVVQDYLCGLREDFERGNRIFGAVIIHSPKMNLFARLEWNRLKIELSYCRWSVVMWFRLRTGAIYVRELRRLTEVVATLAYHVRTMLSILERSGNMDFVDSILKRV